MAGVPVLVAETDAKARYLATTSATDVPEPDPQPACRAHASRGASGLERVLRRLPLRPSFRAAIVGSSETVREKKKLEDFLRQTQVNEINGSRQPPMTTPTGCVHLKLAGGSGREHEATRNEITEAVTS